jgi:benzoyl-CoA-dihydrodiol lyase
MTETATDSPVDFETSPDHYRHWRLSFAGSIAKLELAVKEAEGLRPGYSLKLNSYDLSVDIELADALARIRFGHPEVRAVVVTSASTKIFSAGANIYMLAQSSHPFKVNFCKFTNETRLSMEDASSHQGPKFLAALNGTASGGGYELALACDEILLVDDASSAVSLPEVALLAVLPGTGGLTRVVDKRKVRRDLADVFCAMPEGIKGKRAQDWHLVDQAVPRSQFDQTVAARAKALAESNPLPAPEAGVALEALEPEVSKHGRKYRFVTLEVNEADRLATLTIKAPAAGSEAIAVSAKSWALRAFRELDDSLLHLRFNFPNCAAVVLKTEGDPAAVLAADAALLAAQKTHLGRETLGLMRRTLKRLDLTAKTLFAVIGPGSAFAGSLLEIALAADRTYMLDDRERPTALQLDEMQFGPFPMSNGLTRLQTRFLGEPERIDVLRKLRSPLGPPAALEAQLVTFTPDAIDFDEELRLALEERAAISPDALTGMEANLRFAGPETLETKIFGRLSAWQNWIFTRPNATGEKGALTLYGKSGARPDFDLRRT